ncbi:MAG: DUF2961 domain-containing protein [Acidobacteriota bacterium]|nr:DUF2961 domain-containing protein [Acidobacteriota bacterium]
MPAIPSRSAARIAALAAAVCAIVLFSSCAKPAPAPDRKPAVGLEALARPDLLAVLDPTAKAGMISSYDRTGGNDDGFSGKYSFIRKEPGGLVLADLAGPGLITRIHTPTPTDDVIEFYFDGEVSPRLSLKVNELYDGRHSPFLAPLVWTGVGGSVSYVPLAYRKSCKVLVKAESFQFIQINFVTFPAAAAIETFEAAASDAFLSRMEEIRSLFGRTGSDISDKIAPPGAKIETEAVQASLASGQSVTLFESSRPGRVVGLRLGPASAFAGAERDIVLRMFWDGEEKPAVESPVGDFFGYSFGRPSMRSLFAGTSDDTCYVYLPMPFDRSAKIELVSERADGPPVPIRADVLHVAAGRAEAEGRFYARWRRENPPKEGESYTYLKTTGQGRVVGVALQAQGPQPGQTPFFEGDDRVLIDGEFAIPGTGSEDSFNGGWYDVPGRWYGRGSFPLSGCLDYLKPQARTGGYRWFIADGFGYNQNIDFNIEHGPEKNLIATDYASVVFFYARPTTPAAEPLPPAAARRIADPARIVFIPGWNVPIRSFSLQAATLVKTVATIGGERTRILSMRAENEDVFGPHHIAFGCDVPSSGRYRIGIKAILGSEQGIVQLTKNDRPAGEPLDLYALKRSKSDLLPLGELELLSGENEIVLRIVGKNKKSWGQGLDLAEIVLEKK